MTKEYIFMCVAILIFWVASCRMIRYARSCRSKSKFDGRIVINTTDPEKDVLRLEYDGAIVDIFNKDQIVLKVVREGCEKPS